jgi:AcrR family transcriptional regulator
MAKQPQKQPPNKHQARSRETLGRLLDAAQTVFVELGFEKTQLEQIAARAGYTRGAIYAHFSSKEDLFLALIEDRVRAKLGVLRGRLEAEGSRARRLELFRRWISAQVCDPSWGTLTLEFKLYALRRPESRAKLRRAYLLFRASGRELIGLLFGENMTAARTRSAERRLAVMGAVLSGVVLESHFRPELLPQRQVRLLVEELTRSLVSADPA